MKDVNSLNCNEYVKCSAQTITPTSETQKFTSKLPTWFEACNCDQNCYPFGDCCLDAPPVNSNPLKEWSILSVKVSPKFSYTILMKTKCPPEWHNKKVREMCENIGFSEEQDFLLPEFGHFISLNKDEFLLWHVSSKTSQITYRNIYCGLCNNETELESWTQRIRCIKNQNGEKCSPVYYSAAPDFIIQEKIKRKPIQIQISSTCNIGWYKTNIQLNSSQTIEIVKNCARFYAPVVVQDNVLKKLTAFKNEFCAICSGYHENQLICPIDSEQHFQHQLSTQFNSFTTFDTNFITGGKIPNMNESCPPGNVYNPYEKKCRLILIPDQNKDSNKDKMLNDGNDDKDDSDDDNDNINVTLSTETNITPVNDISQSKVSQKSINSLAFSTKSIHLFSMSPILFFISFFIALIA